MSNELSPVEKVLDRLDDYKERWDEFRARCPAHNGNSGDSLSIKEGDDGCALLRCHASCDLQDIVDALGLGIVDLFPHNGRASLGAAKKAARKTNKDKEEILTTDDLPDGTYYEFSSPAGEVLYIQRHKGPYYRKVGEDRWRLGLEEIPRVLYNLPELIDGVRTGRTVYHLEGPKDCETARERLGVVATTSGGVSTWRAEFKSFYTGADVVVIPDNDGEGRDYAEVVARDLAPVAKRVRILALQDLPEKGDLTDWLDAGHTKEEFFAAAEEAPVYSSEGETWPEPAPVEVGLPDVEPLDERMVPDPLRGWVVDTSRRMDNAPPDFAAAAAIVVAGALVGRKVGIRPKRRDDWSVVPNIWGGLVGLPASMKTPTLNQVLKPVQRLAAEAREEHEEALKKHDLDLLVAEARRKAAKDNLQAVAKKVAKSEASEGDLQEARAELEALEEPEAPTARRYTTNDTSVEKMAELLMANPDGLLLYRDELTGWLKSLDKAGHEAARAFYLEAWNGDGSHEVDRIGRGSLFVPAVCVSVLGGIQPGPLSVYVEGAFDEAESADGLLQRLQVLVYPDRGDFDPTDLAPDIDARSRAYDAFKGLAEIDVGKFVGGVKDEEGTPCVHFDDDAQEIFDGWRDSFEREVISGGYPAALESHFMKYRSLFASLALIFEAVDFVDGIEGAGIAVSKKNAARAYVWLEYLKTHAIRIYSPMLDTPARRATALLEHIYKGDVADGDKTRDIWRRGWSRLASADDLAEALDVLEEHGWVRREVVKPDGGGRPSETVRLHPELR